MSAHCVKENVTISNFGPCEEKWEKKDQKRLNIMLKVPSYQHFPCSKIFKHSYLAFRMSVSEGMPDDFPVVDIDV